MDTKSIRSHLRHANRGVVNTIDKNVYTEAVALGGGNGWGTGISGNSGYNFGTVNFSNNIMTQTASPTIGWGIMLDAGSFGGTLTNNIFFKWPSPIVDSSGGTFTFTGYNVQDINGANNLGGPEPFPNPGRTVGTYYDSIVGSSGHTSFDFIAAARKQSKDNWNPALTAAAVNDYIRAGFGITTSNSPPPPTTSPPPPTADTTSPSVPTGVTATAVSGTQVNLSWTASTDNLGVAGYKVFRNGTQVGTATTTSYQDTGLSGGTAYSYTVAAYDAAGNTSAQSASASVTTPAPDVCLGAQRRDQLADERKCIERQRQYRRFGELREWHCIDHDHGRRQPPCNMRQRELLRHNLAKKENHARDA